jgi:hypothetical protein
MMYDWKDLNRQYSKGNGAGHGFAVGDESFESTQIPAEAVEEEGWELLDTDTDGTVLAKKPSGQLVVVGDGHGAWGVEVTLDNG